MQYSITINIPDELLSMMQNPALQSMISDMGLKFVNAGPATAPSNEPEVTVQDMNAAAKAACATPEGRDAARELLTSMGIKKLSEAAKESWPQLVKAFTKIAKDNA